MIFTITAQTWQAVKKPAVYFFAKTHPFCSGRKIQREKSLEILSEAGDGFVDVVFSPGMGLCANWRARRRA
jgi:hypothetical protein